MLHSLSPFPISSMIKSNEDSEGDERQDDNNEAA